MTNQMMKCVLIPHLKINIPLDNTSTIYRSATRQTKHSDEHFAATMLKVTKVLLMTKTQIDIAKQEN